MISDQDLVTCDDFGDCHEDIAIIGIDFIDRRLICGHYLLGTPNEDSFFEYSISLSIVAERKSRIIGNESVAYICCTQ